MSSWVNDMSVCMMLANNMHHGSRHSHPLPGKALAHDHRLLPLSNIEPLRGGGGLLLRLPCALSK